MLRLRRTKLSCSSLYSTGEKQDYSLEYEGLDSGYKTTVFLLTSIFKIMESFYDLCSDAESRDTVEKASVPA